MKPRFSAADSLPVLLKENLIELPLNQKSKNEIDAQSGNIRIVQSTTKNGDFALDFFDGDEKIMSFNSMDLFKMEPMQKRPNFDEQMPKKPFEPNKNNTRADTRKEKGNNANGSKGTSSQEVKSDEDKEYEVRLKKWEDKKKELDGLKSLWEEKFGSFKDEKRDGPKCILTFFNFEYVISPFCRLLCSPMLLIINEMYLCSCKR